MSATITKEKPKILESAITVLHLFHFEKPGGWEEGGQHAQGIILSSY